MVGLHAFSTWLWICWYGHYISFASCGACFPFRLMDIVRKMLFTNSKVRLFEATVTPIACFTALNRSIRWHDLHILDVEVRRLVRSVLGPPSGVCWFEPVAWNFTWMECASATNPRIQTPQILGGRLRCVIIGNWRATLRTFHPIVEQNEH